MSLKFKKIYTINSLEEVSFANTFCFYGENLDDRGSAAYSKIQKDGGVSTYFSYDHHNYSININSETISMANFYEYMQRLPYTHILVEATTLSFPEILLILNAINSNDHVKQIDFLYIEPEEYKQKNTHIYTYGDFDLSDRYEKYESIPGFIKYNDAKIELVAFLGFERSRLGQLLQNDDGATYNKLSPIIPLPAFAVGWENRTITSHLEYFTPSYGFTRLKYVGANNPYQAYTLLNDIAINKYPFRVAPIGTKPNAIGCAVFLINARTNDFDVDVIYDFPKKSKGRSDGIGKINIYSLLKS